MAFERWTPRQDYTKREEFLLRRLRRTRKLFAFLRDHRHELFDDGFQAELEAMYRDTGAGREPVPPALLAMIVLLQSYLGMSDAEAVELTWWTCAGRWCWIALGGQNRMCPGDTGGFSRTAHPHWTWMALLERTVELARQPRLSDWKKLPKNLRVAIDSSPLEGAAA